MLDGRLRRYDSIRKYIVMQGSKSECVYYVSPVIMLFMFCFVNLVVYLFKAILEIEFIYYLCFSLVITTIIIVPLILLKVKVGKNNVVVKLFRYEKTILLIDIIFVGKLYYSKYVKGRKVFTYGIIYKDNGGKRIISFPKLNKQKEMIYNIKSKNKKIEICDFIF